MKIFITKSAPQQLVNDVNFPLIAESSRVPLESDSISSVGPSESVKATSAFIRM